MSEPEGAGIPQRDLKRDIIGANRTGEYGDGSRSGFLLSIRSSNKRELPAARVHPKCPWPIYDRIGLAMIIMFVLAQFRVYAYQNCTTSFCSLMTYQLLANHLEFVDLAHYHQSIEMLEMRCRYICER